MTLEGTVRNGVVVFDQAEELPEGTRVKVVVEPSEQAPSHTDLLELAGTIDDLPADFARNHNHYLHGHEKQ